MQCNSYYLNDFWHHEKNWIYYFCSWVRPALPPHPLLLLLLVRPPCSATSLACLLPPLLTFRPGPSGCLPRRARVLRSTERSPAEMASCSWTWRSPTRPCSRWWALPSSSTRTALALLPLPPCRCYHLYHLAWQPKLHFSWPPLERCRKWSRSTHSR